MGPCLFSIKASVFASPDAKHVGPCQRIMQTLSYVFWEPQTPSYSNILFLSATKVVPGRVPHPIIFFIGPWDNFMVHGVNPLVVSVWGWGNGD